MRLILPILALGLGAATANASETPYSDMIRDHGLAGTEMRLMDIADPTQADLFALGGVRFLSTVETALQVQYEVGMDLQMARRSGLPLIGMPLVPNPDPAPFRASFLEEVMTAALADLDGARDALDQVTDPEVAVVINTGDIWFDVNANRKRDIGESFYELVAGELNARLDNDPTITPVVRFDYADVAWLQAYTNVLSGVGEVVLSVDTASAIERVTESLPTIQDVRDIEQMRTYTLQWESYADVFAMYHYAMDMTPDAARTQKAYAHLVAMIGHNKDFWARLAAETDNDREWIPNKDQQSALPIPFPEGMDELWQGVLAEAEMVLNGELLIPHWRLGKGAGLDLKAMMMDPPSLEPIGLVQGGSLTPYMRSGEVMHGRAWRAFSRMMSGDDLLYAVILN